MTHGFSGYAEGKKISGSGTFTGQLVVPFMEVVTSDPDNNTYLPMVNKAAGPSVVVKGIHTASWTMRTVLMSAWATPAALNSFILTLDANNDTDLWAWRFVEDDGAEVHDGCRCAALSLAAAAQGGPVACDMGWLTTNPVGVTSFTGSGSTNAGQGYNAGQIDFGSAATADLVKEWRLNIMRPNAWDMFFNRTYYPSDVSSGQITGTFTLIQSARAATIPSATVTLRFYTGDPGSQTLAITITLNINRDMKTRPRNVGFGNVARDYSLINLSTGVSPVVIA